MTSLIKRAALFLAVLCLVAGSLAGPAAAQSQEDLYFEAISLEETATTKSDFTKAAGAYMELLKRYPESENQELVGASLYALGEIFLLRLDRKGEARWAFQEIKRRLPGTSWVQRAEERLEEVSGHSETRPRELGGSMKAVASNIGIGIGSVVPQTATHEEKPGRRASDKSVFDASALGMSMGIGIPTGGKKPPVSPGVSGIAAASLAMEAQQRKNQRNRDEAFFADLGVDFTVPGAGGDLKYLNKNAGFSLEVPDSQWAVTEDVEDAADDMECMVFRNPELSKGKNAHVPSFNVIVKHFNQPLNTIKLLSVVRKSVDQMDGVSLLEEKGRTIGGAMVIIRKYETRFDGKPMHQLQALMASGERAFILTGTFDPKAAPEAEESFAAMIESFRVN